EPADVAHRVSRCRRRVGPDVAIEKLERSGCCVQNVRGRRNHSPARRATRVTQRRIEFFSCSPVQCFKNCDLTNEEYKMQSSRIRQTLRILAALVLTAVAFAGCNSRSNQEEAKEETARPTIVF